MAEIKSTLDIVMEKTKNMTQTDDDRASQKRKDRKNQAKSLMLKIVDGMLVLERLDDQIKEVAGEDAPAVRAALYEILLENVAIDHDNSVLIEAINILSPDSDDIIEKIGAVLQEYNHGLSGLMDSFGDRAREALHKKGISGPAIQPKVESDPAFGSAREELKERYQQRLGQTKAKWLQAYLAANSG